MKTFTIDSLFDDDHNRVVRAFCKIKQNIHDRSNPLVTVAFRKFQESLEGYRFSKEIEYRDISLAELDIVRIGSVCTGKEVVKGNYCDPKSLKRGVFEFDLRNQSIEFNELHQLASNFAEDSLIGKTRVAKLISYDQREIYIQSLEIFTSLYVPKNKNIRRGLVNFNVDEVVDHFVPSRERGMLDDRYKLPTGWDRRNAVFLAYLGNNSVTKKRLSNIRAQILSGEGFIDARPYHPSYLKFEASYYEVGKKVFIHRVVGFETPTEHKLIEIREKTNTSKNERVYRGTPQTRNINNSDVQVQHAQPPSKGGYTQYIETDVSVVDNNLIDEVLVEKEYLSERPIGEETEKPEQFSSGSESSENESTGKLDIGSESPDEEKERQGFLEALELIADSDESKLSGFRVQGCFDNLLVDIDSGFYAITFQSGEKEPKKKCWEHLWFKKATVKNPKISFQMRKMALIKVKFDGKVMYFVEIEPWKTESYRGMLFSAPDGDLSCEIVKNIMSAIICAEGKLLDAENDLRSVLKKVKIFKHSKDLGQRLKNLMEEHVKS